MKLRQILGIATAGALLLAVVFIIIAVNISSPGDPTAAPDASQQVPRSECVRVNVVSSSEKSSLLGVLAKQYNATNPSVGGTCVDVQVATKASGGAEQALAAGWNEAADGANPTVWTPASSLWLRLLDERLDAQGKPALTQPDPASLVKTPVVFAMPRPMAQALGWPGKPIGWGTLTALATNPAGWAAYGHPEWGKFTLGKTHPELSTSGLAGTIGEFFAATGLTTDLKLSDVQSPATRQIVAQTESAVTHYGDTTLTFLSNQLKYDDKFTVPYVSAVVVEEKSVIDYNAGNPSGKAGAVTTPPRTPMVAVQPAEGTMYSDNPYAIIDAAWVTDAQKQAAAGFLEFLQTPASVATLTAAGFRTPDGVLDPKYQSDPNYTTSPPSVIISPPSGAVIGAVQSAWKDLRKGARVMIVLDVSGSMEEDAGDGQSKLEKATAAVRKSLTEFTSSDEVGLAIFTSDLEDAQDGIYKVLVPVAPMRVNAARIGQALALAPQNATPLYDTIALAQSEAEAALDPSKINAVVVLTDGQDSGDGMHLASLLDRIAVTSENRSTNVKVFTIGYGPDADMDVLAEISGATGASAYDATKPANIEKVLTNVLSNF